MKKLAVALCIPLLLLGTSCGGGGGDSAGNPANGANLTEPEAESIATALGAAMNASSSSAPSKPAAKQDDVGVLAQAATVQQAISGTQACQVAGRISYTGNMTYTYSVPPAAPTWSIYSLVTFHISDPTNNLNDCETSPGVILDGTLTVTIAGTHADGVGASLVGDIEVNSRGPTGGLIPRGSCYVFLNVPRGGNRATGSICGHAVN